MSTKSSLYYYMNTLLRNGGSLKLAAIVCLCTLSGCSSLTFYTQAVVGQTSLLMHRRDIDLVINDQLTDETIRKKLQLVQRVLHYAKSDLNLPVDGAYSTYVETGKPYVVWNVFAAPEFSLDMESFCYPIAGCVSFRGYFQQKKADAQAATLNHGGYDVFVGGVAAYSTLGWFSDPVLDTFLRRSEVNLAALLFHELAHRVVYIPGDTAFNESFATTIEENALNRWLSSTAQDNAYAEYLDRRSRRRQVLELIRQTRESLGSLYSSGLSKVLMRDVKQRLIEELRLQYTGLRATWDGKNDFQNWMSGEINNAKLGTITEYNTWVPAFNVLLAENENSISQFIQAVEVISKLRKQDRDEFLKLRLQQ